MAVLLVTRITTGYGKYLFSRFRLFFGSSLFDCIASQEFPFFLIAPRYLSLSQVIHVCCVCYVSLLERDSTGRGDILPEKLRQLRLGQMPCS